MGAGEKAAKQRYSFWECMHGEFAHPVGRLESIVFDLLFVVGMATTMVLIVNFGIRPLTGGATDSVGARLLSCAEMLPGLFAAALAIRLLYGDRLSMWVMKRLIAPRFHGWSVTLLVVLTNVAIMAPPMCACAVLISGAPLQAVAQAFGTVFPYAALAGFALSMALVRPLVMMVFSNVIVPRHRG